MDDPSRFFETPDQKHNRMMSMLTTMAALTLMDRPTMDAHVMSLMGEPSRNTRYGPRRSTATKGQRKQRKRDRRNRKRGRR